MIYYFTTNKSRNNTFSTTTYYKDNNAKRRCKVWSVLQKEHKNSEMEIFLLSLIFLENPFS